MLVYSIENFADFLQSSAAKWRNSSWVEGQYSHHVEECKELSSACDPHLQAELLDKLIISTCLKKIDRKDEEKFRDSLKELEESLKGGVKEFASVEDLLVARTEKFISKLHL